MFVVLLDDLVGSGGVGSVASLEDDDVSDSGLEC